MEVICLQEEAFYSLIDKVTDYIKEKHSIREDKWISDEEAMRILRISSRSTLQKFRDEGRIRFTQPATKHILYERASIDEYLEKNARETL